MWIPKWERDYNKGVISPIPTQVVSNEEFIPRPQNSQQAEVEARITAMAEEKAKKLGMDRRSFMQSSMAWRSPSSPATRSTATTGSSMKTKR